LASSLQSSKLSSHQDCSLTCSFCRYNELRQEKKELQILLHQFNAKFETDNKRKVKYEGDYNPVRAEYQRYKVLSLILNLMFDANNKFMKELKMLLHTAAVT
jgi:hypothetical protein